MVQGDQLEGKLWESHVEEDMGISPEGHFRCRPPSAHGLFQPQHTAADAGLPLHPTGGDQRRIRK